ncbi:MAG: DUF368 domain-containing protein [Planctomycetota bacterium]
MSGDDTPRTEAAPADTWRAAWNASPGPRTWGAAVVLALKGVAMGTANIIPGVSGGTIALITGIYRELLSAIGAFDAALLRDMFGRRLRSALRRIPARFLIPLGIGILGSTVGIAGLMKFLLAEHAVLTWSFFFGLILASVWVVGKEVARWTPATGLLVAAGTALAYWVVGLIPVETPEAWWFVLFCGAVAMCAMILPGLSGSFLLVILGKYEFVLAAVEHPFTREHALRLGVFLVGAVAGILSFARLLEWCLKRFYSQTMAVLMGLMIGALRKIWPWKDVLETRRISSKTFEWTTNVLPEQFDASVAAALGVLVAGFVLVLVMERVAARTADTVTPPPAPVDEN